MADELTALSRSIDSGVALVTERAPNVVIEHRGRLLARINDAMADNAISVDDKDLLRELSIFADRCDITERNHTASLASPAIPDVAGRRDILRQETGVSGSGDVSGSQYDWLKGQRRSDRAPRGGHQSRDRENARDHSKRGMRTV